MNVIDKLILLIALLGTSFLPLSAEEDADTTKHTPEEYLSNTLPVLYINTDNEEPVIDKTEYINGEYYLDANGCASYVSIGTAENPLPLEIKGRGNSTWHFPKKPYRLKLDTKMPLLGMPKSKHWLLMAAYADWLAHGRDYLNFKISEKLGMPYTTRCVPCEVVLNGDYIGMYFLTEQIRIDPDRVNIKEQDDEETNPTSVTGGWLLEIDNYRQSNQIRFVDINKPKHLMSVTYHKPEELSQVQLDYLTDLLNKVNLSVNTDDKTSREWERYIDIDALARFYMLLEAIDDQEGFSGSCWFSKDRGEDAKLVWGPYWDSGSSLGNRNINAEDQSFFYENEPDYAYNHWIGEIVKFPRFQVALKKWWKKYRDEVFPTMQAEVDAYGQLTEAALTSDYQRWGDKSATQLWYYRDKYVRLLGNKRNFLISNWDVPNDDINWTTYYSDVALALPQGVKAYVVKEIDDNDDGDDDDDDNGIELSEVNYIPANVGVLLFGISDFDEIDTTPYENRDAEEISSLLVGSIEPQVVDDGYVLHNNQFVLAPAGTPIEAHRCYIPVNSDESTPTIIEIAKSPDPHTAINNVKIEDTAVKVYPNPTSDIVHVESNDLTSVSVFSINGSELLSHQANGDNKVVISLGTLPRGVYFLKAITKNGEAVKKLIIE